MLRRDRQIRTVIHQLADASLFAIAFWVAYALRANPEIIAVVEAGASQSVRKFRVALSCVDSRHAAGARIAGIL